MFESVFKKFREKSTKYVLEITSKSVLIDDQPMMMHLMSPVNVKIAAVELVENLELWSLINLKSLPLCADLTPFLQGASAPVGLLSSHWK